MNRIARLALALAALSALSTTAAGAVTWHNSGNTSFTATAGATTVSSTGVSLNCTNATVTGTTGVSPFVGATWAAVSGTAIFGGCAVSGITTTVDCKYTATAATQTAGVTGGNVDVFCTTYQFGTPICITSGSTSGTYHNPSGATSGRATLHTGGSVIASNPPSGINCGLGNGDRIHLSATTYTITSVSGGTGTLGPIITRTP